MLELDWIIGLKIATQGNLAQTSESVLRIGPPFPTCYCLTKYEFHGAWQEILPCGSYPW